LHNSASSKVRLGVVGAGHWAQTAHIPSFQSCKEAEIVAVCDSNEDQAKRVAEKFQITRFFKDYREMLNLDNVDAVDICSSAKSHYDVASEAIKLGKPVLCEKPLAMNLREARSLWALALEKRVKTKMGFTFRYSPALRRMKELISEGFIGEPYLINGFEQNSQFINPKTPFRWDPSDHPQEIMPGSLEEYAPHLIDIALWMFGDVRQVVGNMRNFVPERFIRDAGKTMPINIEDATVWLAEFSNNAQGTFQSSFVAVGNYPGVEVRVFGSRGAIVARLVQEGTINETLKVATPEKPDFQETVIPSRLYGSGRKDDFWVELYFRNLAQSFISEILEDRESGATFLAGLKVQEVEDAVFLSHKERRWVSLPLE
jgi:predicted dehydrogenase